MANFNANNPNPHLPVPFVGWQPSAPVSDPRCHVCASRYRNQIDREILMGHGYATIARRYQEDYGDDSITRRSVMNHAKRHTTLEEAALRKIIEDRYAEDDANVEEAVGILLGQKSMLESLAYKGYKSAISGETKVEVKDWLTIMNELKSLMMSETDIEKEELRRDFQFFLEAVMEITPTDEYEKIAERFNEKRDGMRPKTLAQLIDPKSLDPEVYK